MSIDGGSTHSSSSGRLRLLRLFLDQLLNLSGNLYRLWLLCCTIWIILIGHWRFVGLRILGLLLLLFLGDGRLISRRRSSEVNRLYNLYIFRSFNLMSILMCPFAGLPILKVTWKHNTSVFRLWLLQLLEKFLNYVIFIWKDHHIILDTMDGYVLTWVFNFFRFSCLCTSSWCFFFCFFFRFFRPFKSVTSKNTYDVAST